MNIRRAQEGDAPALAALLSQLGYPVTPAEVPARLERFATRGNGQVLVAESDGEVLAFAALELTYPIHHSDPVCHLTAFAVASSARRRGVGRQLLAAVEALARDAGCGQLVVTSAEHRTDAHAFYPANGWAYSGRRFGRPVGMGKKPSG
jgi:GNAT superfamily N-acetyltransferase